MADFNSSQTLATSPLHNHPEAWGLRNELTQVIKMKRNLNGTSGKRFKEETFLKQTLGRWVGTYCYCNTIKYSVLLKSRVLTYFLV